MATAETLVLKVIGLIAENPGYGTDEILPLLNEGLQAIAAEPNFLLSSLDSMATVTTVLDINVADLPTDYGQGIYAASDDSVPLEIYDSWSAMARYYGDLAQEGSVSSVATKDDQLMYLPIPTEATDLVIFYYRKPIALVSGEEPEGFNNQTRVHGENAMAYYAAMKIWSDVEIGQEGRKVNTADMEGRYHEAFDLLKSMTRQGISRPRSPRNKLW